jgi:hypothetical protein
VGWLTLKTVERNFFEALLDIGDMRFFPAILREPLHEGVSY